MTKPPLTPAKEAKMPDKVTQVQRVVGLLYGHYMTAEDIRKELHRLTGNWITGSNCTARIREARKRGWAVRCDRYPEGRYYYIIPKTKKA